ncbi:hypothetical protein [Methanococcoides alaskense]|uniref:Uncharacterized protein n=1 Tax=Methanococcoides alaskense TaxID=325778 RepID=A0AA90TZW1_9EURY|nr:hypothetical protein [Methanococcoides alaskense]MDA0524824.1 hypothetical protein [Methanococcoides alaskense]MDR6223052.1 hypothetical protein [Methanococcoides alaskense]
MVPYQHLLIIACLILSIVAGGCTDIGNDVDELGDSISQARADLQFLQWAANSTGTILDDYSNIKNATSERNTVLMEGSGRALKEDSEKALTELDSFSVSPSLQDVVAEYRDFLQRSYNFGDFVETNSQTLDLEALEKTLEMINETSDLFSEISEMAEQRN